MIVTRPTMTEDAARFYTSLFSALTIASLIAGGAYSILQYFDTRSRENQTYALQVATAQLEAQKPFSAKLVDLCSEASTAAATLATTDDAKKQREAADNFWRLWDGPLAIVEGQSVASAMIDFGNCLKAKCGNLPALSIELSHSCRQEISDHFDLHLSELTPRETRQR